MAWTVSALAVLAALSGAALVRYYTDPGYRLGGFTHPEPRVRRAAIDDRVSKPFQFIDDGLLDRKAAVIGTNRDVHYYPFD